MAHPGIELLLKRIYSLLLAMVYCWVMVRLVHATKKCGGTQLTLSLPHL